MEAATPQRLLTLNRGHWDDRGNPLHPRLELRRGPQPHPHRARSGEHDPAAALRHRRHQRARARRRPDHAQSGQEPAPRPRLPENDRQRRPATSTRLTTPLRSASIDSPNPRTPGASGHAQMKPCPTLAARGDRYTAAPWQPNPLPSPRNDPNESGRTMIACRESATKIRTNLPCRTHGGPTRTSRAARLAHASPLKDSGAGAAPGGYLRVITMVI